MNLNATYGRIAEYIKSHESETYSQIASTLGLSRSQVSRIARLQGLKRAPGKRASALEAAVVIIDAAMPQPGSVPTGEAATPPAEEPISAELEPSLAGEALSVAADTRSTESAVV